MEKVSTKAEDSVSSLMSQGKIVQITCYGRSTFERIAKSIECQKHREFIDYIRQYAYRHSKKNLYKTYGLVDTNEDLMAYISFSLSSIDNDKKLKDETDIPSSITYPISALEITRLLVSDKFKKQGLGTQLLNLADILAFVIAHQVGCKLIIVYAKSEAENFYAKKHFKTLKADEENTVLMFKIVEEDIPSDLLEQYIEFCNLFSLQSLKTYLNAIKPTNPKKP